MHLAQPELRKHLAQRFIAFLQVLQVTFLAFLDKRKDNIHLSALVDLLSDALIEACHLRVKLMYGHDGLASGWQLVYNAHVEVAVYGHGQGARNGRSRHHQHVGWVVALAPKLGPLRHAKAVLLVYDGQSQAVEHHIVFYHGMCAHQYLHVAAGQAAEHVLAPLAFHHAGEQLHPHVHIGQKVAQCLQVLLGQYLCGCHDARLITVVYGQ